MTRDLRRHHRERVIQRKINTIEATGGHWVYVHRGTLDKGKIHCSCPMCTGYRKHRKDKERKVEESFAYAGY